MDQELKLIIFLIWFPQAVRQVLAWLYWWQVKEYRFDRFKVFLSSSGGRKNLEVNFIAFKFLVLLSLVVFREIFWIIFFVLLILDLKLLLEVVNKKLRRPVFTQRASLIVATSLIFIFLVFTGAFWLEDINLIPILVFGELSLLLTPVLGILWTIPVVNEIKKKEIQKAKKRLQKIKPTVIGVTGSYGKTITKEFIAHLLSQKYKTAKTTGSENTELGIARKTISFVKRGVKFFVVEMGAYKREEVKVLTQIVDPSVGVITGIEPQHLSLFGSLSEIKKTKFELIEVLPKKGVAVFNLSNKYCRELAERARRLYPDLKVVGYFLEREDKNNIATEIESKILSIDVEGVTFEVRQGKVTKKLFAPVKGMHFIENLSGAILVARLFGLTWKQIEEGCRSIQLPEKVMRTYKLKTNAYVIDDTYNATPKGFEAAVKYIFLFRGRKKAVITQGIIELGKASEKAHRNLGKLMGDKIDEIIFTNREFVKSMKQGLGSRKKELKVIEKPEKLLEKFVELVDKNYVILLEGKLPKSLMDIIEEYKNV